MPFPASNAKPQKSPHRTTSKTTSQSTLLCLLYKTNNSREPSIIRGFERPYYTTKPTPFWGGLCGVPDWLLACLREQRNADNFRFLFYQFLRSLLARTNVNPSFRATILHHKAHPALGWALWCTRLDSNQRHPASEQ